MNFKLFTIFHKYIIDDMYKKIDLNKITFIKCNPKFTAQHDLNIKYDIIKESEIGKFYNPKLQTDETPYHAPSAIYTIYKNKKYNYPFIGFVEYDIEMTCDVLDKLTVISNKNKRIIVPFSYRWSIQDLYNQQNFLAANKNAIEQIIIDYNNFNHTNYKIADLLKLNPIICTQQSFFCDKESFERLMKFISHIIETGKAERKGSRPRPSTLMERYIGIGLLLDSLTENVPIIPITCKHLGLHEWKYNQSKINFNC